MSTKQSSDFLDTREAREKIMSRIRTAQGRPEMTKDREEEQSLNYMGMKPIGPQPRLDLDPIDHFVLQSERLQTSIARLERLSELPGEVAAYLTARNLGLRAIIWPAFASLDWAAAGLQVEARAPVRDVPIPDMVGITGCFAAIAETGTLAMVSGPETPASMALLPETHIAVVARSRILPYMEDVFALLRHERGEPPRALNFISGPSRTGDIEQTIVLGAHGPYRVHVVIINEL